METGMIDAVGALWPAAAPYLALWGPIQLLARALETVTRRRHRTQVNTVLRRIAAFPGTAAPHPGVDR